jgi:hypothetical protein
LFANNTNTFPYTFLGFGDDYSGENSNIRRLIAKVNDDVMCDEYLDDSGVVPVAKKTWQAPNSLESDDGSVVLPLAKKARAPKTKSESWLSLIQGE